MLVQCNFSSQLSNFFSYINYNCQEAREYKNKTSILELEDTDSESTMKDIEDNLGGAEQGNMAVSSLRRAQHKPRKQSRRRGDTREAAVGVDVSDGAAVSLLNPTAAAAVASGVSAVPNAMHFRFMTELHRFEEVSATERFLAELEQIKRSAFDSQRSLTEMQAEMRAQRQREDQERGQRELEVQYAAKLKQLLDQVMSVRLRGRSFYLRKVFFNWDPDPT